MPDPIKKKKTAVKKSTSLKKKPYKKGEDPTKDRLSGAHPKYNVKKTKGGPANEYRASPKSGSGGSFTVRASKQGASKKGSTVAKILKGKKK